MSAPNNRSSQLIAYGSAAPGGARHGVFAPLPGAWRRGFIQATRHDDPDDIGPGEGDLVEAWLLELQTSAADEGSPEHQAWRRDRHERWIALDAAMGAAWGRDERSWWPEGANPVRGSAGQRIGNVYLPLARFPYLANRDDVPHPDDEDDLPKLWGQVKRGEKRYDWSIFISLIKDARPDEFDALFGDLPGGAEFLSRLRRLFEDHRLSETSVLTDGGPRFYWYVYPLERNALPMPALLDLAREDIAQRAGFLRRHGKAEEAEILGRLRFTEGKAEDPQWEPAGAAMEEYDDVLSSAERDRPRWKYCLGEACYGIAASFELKNWLMLALNERALARPAGGLLASLWQRRSGAVFDLEPSYRLWKAGGHYVLDGETCRVHAVERRKT